MDKKLKVVITSACAVAILILMLPTHVAWAGMLYQTVPTMGPSPTPRTLPTQPQPSPTSISTQFKPTENPPGSPEAPTAQPTPTQRGGAALPTQEATISRPTQFPVTPATTGVGQPTSPTLSMPTAQETMRPTDSVRPSATLPPGFIPTEPNISANALISTPTAQTNANSGDPSARGAPSSVSILVGAVIGLGVIAAIIKKVVGQQRP